MQELNSRGSHLLFRDKAHQLHLFNLATQQRSSLLSFCQYVQWVPGSDIVVAQSRSNLCVWYSINNTDRYTPEASHLILHRPLLLDWLAAVSERQSVLTAPPQRLTGWQPPPLNTPMQSVEPDCAPRQASDALCLPRHLLQRHARADQG